MDSSPPRGVPAPVLVGAVCGLAWAASLRAVMAEFAGPESTFDWFGTFEGVLLPGVVVGALLGWAAHLQGRGSPPPRWLVAAPLVFVLATPSVLVSVFVDGLGGGAIAVPLFGMAGGYALAGRGPRWARWAAAAVALLPVPAWLVAASSVGGPLALDTPRGAWIAVLFLSLLAVLAFACTLPHRAPAELLTSRRRLVLVGVVCGLAWGASMRGFMAAAAGTDSPSVVSWLGTFGIILPISAVVGGLLGWAEHLRRTGDTRRRRLPRLAPLLFTVDPASLAVTLPALAGGYVLAGEGVAARPVGVGRVRASARPGVLRRGGGGGRQPPRARRPAGGLGHRAAVLPPRRADHRLRDPAAGAGPGPGDDRGGVRSGLIRRAAGHSFPCGRSRGGRCSAVCARSASTTTTALSSGLTSSIRRRCASTTSRADACPVRISSASSRALRRHSSSLTRHPRCRSAAAFAALLCLIVSSLTSCERRGGGCGCRR